MPRISLCMIVRDEQTMLLECLESVQGVVDEIIVIDTGSTDATKSIAEAAGAKVFDHEWSEDFAAARNESLAHATGDFVLILDADERLAQSSRETLRTLVETGGFDCGMVRLHNAKRIDVAEHDILSGEERLNAPALLPRLLRRTNDLRYEGIIHESVQNWVVSGRKTVCNVDVDVVHLGYVESVQAERGKASRNRTLLEARCARDPSDPVAWGYLALRRMMDGDRKGAAEAVDRGWPLLLDNPIKSPIRLAIVRARFQIEAGRIDEALKTLDVAESRCPNNADLLYLRGCAFLTYAQSCPAGTRRATRALRAAKDALTHALSRDGKPEQTQIIGGATSWAAQARLGDAELEMGQPAEALTAFECVLAAQPQHEQALLGRVEALIGLHEHERAFSLLREVTSERPDRLVLLARLAEATGTVDEVPNFSELAEARERVYPYHQRRRKTHNDELRLLASLVEGSPVAGAGGFGTLCALAGRRPMARGACTPTDAEIERVTRLLCLSNHAYLLAGFFEPRAQQLVPGLAERVRALLSGWGLEASDDGEPEPVFLVSGSDHGLEWMADILDAAGLDVDTMPAAWTELLEQGEDNADAVREQLQAKHRGGQVWVVPPGLARHDNLVAAFPRAIVLHLRSDPGWVAVSSPMDPVEACEAWVERTREISETYRGSTARYHEVEYQRLLAAPPQELSLLLATTGRGEPEAALRRMADRYPGSFSAWRKKLDPGTLQGVEQVRVRWTRPKPSFSFRPTGS